MISVSKNKNRSNYTIIALLIFCVVFFMYQYGLRVSLTSVLNDELLKHFSISASDLGTLVSVFFLTYTLMQIPSGLVSDNWSLKMIPIIAFCFTSVGFILFVSSSNFLIAILAQILIGIGSSFAFVLIFKVTGTYFSRKNSEFLASLGISCGNFGPVLISPMIAYITLQYYWKSVILFAAFLGLLGAFLGYIGIDEKKLKSDGAVAEKIKKYSTKDSLKIICSSRQPFLIGIFSMLILGPIQSFCDVWGLQFLRSVYEVEKLQASSAIGLIYTGMIFGCPFFAYIAGKLKSYKIPMIFGGCALFFSMLIVIFLKIPFTLLSILLFLVGLLTTCQFLVYPAAISGSLSEISATMTGVVNMITMLGCTFMVKLIGLLMDFSLGEKIIGGKMSYSVQDYRYAMMSIVASILLAVFIALFIKDSYKR